MPSLKTAIMRFVLSDLDLTTDQLRILLERRYGHQLSKVTISGVRRSFLESLRVLNQEGIIDVSALPRGRYRHIGIPEQKSQFNTRQEQAQKSQSHTPQQQRTRPREEPDNSIDWSYWKRSSKPRRNRQYE